MAIDKNFVIKNGLEVNTNVLVAAADEKQVGIGTTRPYYKLHVGGGEGNRGGIGATDITISGIATLGVGNSSQGALNVVGISTFDGDIDLLGSAGVSTVRWDASENRLEFKDNASVGFGTGNDLTLWHDSSTSYIKDTVGDLRIAGDKITLELEDGTDVKVIDQFGVNITGVTTTNRLLVSGISTFTGNVDANGGITANTVIVEDLTNNRVVIAGTGGEIEDDANFTYDGVGLNIGAGSGVTVSNTGNIAAAGIITANGGVKVGAAFTVDANTGNVAVSGILTVGGNLQVTGDITYDEITGRNLNITGITTLAGTSNFDGDVNLGNATSDTITATGRFDSDIVPSTDNARDLGASGLEFKDLYIDGTANIDSLAADTAAIGDLTDNRVVIAGSSGELEDDANFTYDGVGLIIGAGSGVTVSNTGNIAAAGIITANGGVNVGTAVTIDAGTGNVAISGITTIGGNLYVTGDITYDEVTGRNLNITGITTFGDDVLFKGDNYDLQWDKSDDALEFADSAEARFGAGNDLRVYHNGTNSLIVNSTGELKFKSAQYAFENAAGNENLITATENGAVLSYFDNTERLRTAAGGIVVTGIATAGILSITENARIAGIVTADRFIGIHTSTDGGGVGIGSTTAHVGYGITYIDFKGPGVSTVYYSSVTGVSTVYFQGGGSSVGAAGTWQNDGSQGISTAKSVGINTVGVAVTALMGGEKGASSGIGASMQGLYIGNGMMINDNQLNGNHYIGTAFGGIMAGPVTVNGVVTVDGNWAVV